MLGFAIRAATIDGCASAPPMSVCSASRSRDFALGEVIARLGRAVGELDDFTALLFARCKHHSRAARLQRALDAARRAVVRAEHELDAPRRQDERLRLRFFASP